MTINKYKQPMKYITAILAFFLPIQGILLAVGACIILDTITGIWKAFKNEGRKSIRSRIFSNVISKMLLFELTILVLFILDYFLLNEFTSIWFSVPYLVTKVASIVIIMNELLSIKENLESIFKIDFWNMLKEALKRTKELKDEIDEIKE